MWRIEDGMLVREFQAATFPQAIEYVVAVAEEAEAMNHHPDIDIRWNAVTLRRRRVLRRTSTSASSWARYWTRLNTKES